MTVHLPSPSYSSNHTPTIDMFIERKPQSEQEYHLSSSAISVEITPTTITEPVCITYYTSTYDDINSAMYTLRITTDLYIIMLNSKYSTLLQYYMEQILSDTNITVEETKSKFPELFI